MQTALTTPLLIATLSLIVVACGNRTPLLEPPWDEPDGGSDGGAGGSGGSGGTGGTSAKGGASGKGGSGGGTPVDSCAYFCSKCGSSVPNCATQCAQSKAQIGSKCLALFDAYIICAANTGCNQYSCQTEMNAVTQCYTSGPDAGF
ncbi:MAG: hypothetical protein HY898_14535 [Deltaproteobacteria bacterium]|nr:hypothetical protein [Deltaproteobacteria bacterium]